MSNTTKTVKDGLAAYKARHYREAVEIWTALATQGDSEAQFNLGVMYKNGIGVPQNDIEANNWLRKSAEQGHEHAKLIVDVMDRDSEDNLQDEPPGKVS